MRDRGEVKGHRKADHDHDHDHDHDGKAMRWEGEEDEAMVDGARTGFSHEKLDVYRLAIEYCKWAFLIAERLVGKHRHARDQLLRAAQSIPLNIAEGNGRATDADRHHFFSIARGSALECAALQDVLDACRAIQPKENQAGKDHLFRIVAMLTKMGGRGYSVSEEPMLFGQAD